MTKPKQKKPILILGIVTVCVFLLICCCASCAVFSGTIFALWYLPPDPVSPPSTELGENPDFDALFENKDWLFLFEVDDKIIETDITGEQNRVVLDVLEATDGQELLLNSSISISPDGKHVALNYYDQNDTKVDIETILILDILTGQQFTITPTYKKYSAYIGYPVFWLSSTVFGVRMRDRNPSDYFGHYGAILLFDLDDLEYPQAIDIGLCGWDNVIAPDVNNTLLMSCKSETNEEWIIWALDTDGKQVANEEETALYERCIHIRNSNGYECSNPQINYFIDSIEIEPVPHDYPDFLKFFRDNRLNIYLNDILVRTTTSVSLWNVTPFWDADIGMYIWNEGCESYQMDADGHYRFWFRGNYIGKIPNQ